MAQPRPDQIIDYFKYIYKEAKEPHTRAVSDWDSNKELYNDAYSLADKVDPSTQLTNPIVDNYITRLTNFFVRILTKSEQTYYTAKHSNDPVLAEACRNLVGAVLKDNKFADTIFGESFSLALLTSPYINKVSFKYFNESYPIYDDNEGKFDTVMETVGKTVIEPISPYSFMIDPSKMGMYVIEEQHLDMQEFLETATANEWTNINSVILDMKLNPKDTPKDASDNYRPSLTVSYVYSKIVADSTGKVLDTNVHFIVVNHKFVVLYTKNILPKGMFPYVVGFPFKSLTGVYGRGYISKLRSLIFQIIQSWNLIVDGLTLATLGAYEVNTQKIDPEYLHDFTAIRAGKMYKVAGDNVLNKVYNNALDPMSLQVLAALDRELQNRSFQNEFFQGQSTSRGRPTKAEVEIKTGDTLAFFSDLANVTESDILVKLFELVLIHEFMYLDDPFKLDLSSHFETKDSYERIDGLSFNDRMKILKETQVVVEGISSKIAKAGNFNKWIQLLGVLGNIPALQQSIDPAKVAEKIFEALDELPSEILNLTLLSPSEPEQGLDQSSPLPPQGALPAGGGNDAALQQVQQALSQIPQG